MAKEKNAEKAEMREMRQRQRREKRGKERMEKRKYGRNKKKRAANKAAEMENRARMAQIMATEDLSNDIVDTGASMNAKQHKKNLMKYNPVVDKSKVMGGAGMGYGKKHGGSMSGEKYDAKQAYNKNLSPKARLHYLENERHDKTHRHPILKHMRKY